MNTDEKPIADSSTAGGVSSGRLVSAVSSGQEADPTENPPMIIVATEDDFHELVAGSLFGTFAFWKIQTFLRGVLVRAMAASRISREAYRKLSEEQKYLLWVNVYTGADFRRPRFSPEEARQRYEFEGGQIPQSGAVYIQHPYRRNRYLIPSSANLALAREKVFVFNQLAGCLGAKKITLLSGIVKTVNWRGKAKVRLPDAAAQVGISTHVDSESKDVTRVYAEFDKPTTDPFVLEDLRLWAKSDPLFELMTESRLKARLRKQQVTLELKESAQYGASVVGKFRDIGFDVGGEYQALVHSVWQCEIEYWPVG